MAHPARERVRVVVEPVGGPGDAHPREELGRAVAEGHHGDGLAGPALAHHAQPLALAERYGHVADGMDVAGPRAEGDSEPPIPHPFHYDLTHISQIKLDIPEDPKQDEDIKPLYVL